MCLQEKIHGMRIRLQDAKGIFLDLVFKEPKRNPPDKQQDDAAGNKGEEDFEILWITLKVTLQTEVSTLKEAVVSENESSRDVGNELHAVVRIHIDSKR